MARRLDARGQLALGLLIGNAVIALPVAWLFPLPLRWLSLAAVVVVLFDAGVLCLHWRCTRRLTAGSALLAVLLLVPVAVAAQDQTRVDLFKPDGSRAGYAIVDEQRGRVDFYDASSRRTGYGTIDNTGRVERFDLKGQRQTDTPARGETR